jgi:hypothetical protein
LDVKQASEIKLNNSSCEVIEREVALPRRRWPRAATGAANARERSAAGEITKFILKRETHTRTATKLINYNYWKKIFVISLPSKIILD